MTLKYAGIAVVIFTCTAAGFMKSLSLSRRVKELETFISALSFIATEIRYFASPTPVIISKIKSKEEYAGLHVFEICEKNLLTTHDFKKSWTSALDASKQYLSLDAGDIETLKCFGNTFGTTDIEGELANCEHYINSMKVRLESARIDKTKRGRMYSSLGLLTGVLIAAVLI